jgi:hypothetical protein
MPSRFTRFFALKQCPYRAQRGRSTTARKSLSDFIRTFVERVKSGVKALVVKVKYVADDDKPKEPVVTLSIIKNLLGRIADEGNEFPQGTHLKLEVLRAVASEKF